MDRDTLAAVLARTAETHPEATWLVVDEGDAEPRTISWAEALDRAGRTAGVLRDHGVGRRDAVVAHLTNCREFYDLWFETARLGAILVPTNPLLAADELAFALTPSTARLVVTEPDRAAVARQATPSRGPAHVLVTGPAFEAERDGVSPAEAHRVAPTDTAAVLYTSGRRAGRRA